MSWKDIKGSGPWSFSKSGADIRYNEGNLISTVDNPIWSIAHTKKPITDIHSPCGYWINGYVPNIYLTSTMYPIEMTDDMESSTAEIIAGTFKKTLHRYEIPLEEIESGSSTIISGNLKAVMLVYDNWPVEEVESGSSTILSGTLKDVMLVYTYWPVEELESGSSTILSGTLEDILIKYTDWPVEELESGSATITGGTLE